VGRSPILSLLFTFRGLAAYGAEGALDIEARLRAAVPAVKAHRGGVCRFVPNARPVPVRGPSRRGHHRANLRATRDGVPIIVHDDNLHLGTSCGALHAKTLAEFRKCQPK
jgi:hypothetical protein